MSKKVLVLVTLCLGVLPLGMLAEEKPRTIEFVARECTEGGAFSYTASNPETPEHFQSGSLLTIHVAPMPDYDTIFFDLSAHANYAWSGYPQIKTLAYPWFQFINPSIIPEGMIVSSGGSGIPWDTVENNAFNKGTQHYYRNYKFIMNLKSGRSRTVWVEYKAGGVVPDEVAIPIIKALIDNGYDVEIKTEGTIQGVEVFTLGWACLEITRLSKKK